MWKFIKWTSFAIVASVAGLAWLGSQVGMSQVQQRLDANRTEAVVARPAPARVVEAPKCPDVSLAVLRFDHFIENALDAQGLTFEQPSIFLKSQARGASLTSRAPCEYRAWSFVDVRNGFGGFTRTNVKGAVRYAGGNAWSFGSIEMAN